MVQIKEESKFSERNLYITLSACLLASIIGSVVMMVLTSQVGEAGNIARTAAGPVGLGSVTVGSIVIGTLAANLVVWCGVLMIGLLSWAGRSLGLTAPRRKVDVVSNKPNVELSVS